MGIFDDVIGGDVVARQGSGGLFDDVIGKKKQNKGIASDLVTDVKRGVQQLPGAVTGLVDIPVAAVTGNPLVSQLADKAGEVTGFQPSKWAKQAEAEYSPSRQAGRAEVDNAWESGTASDIAGAYLRNPMNIVGSVAESLPSMLAGGLAGRAALGIGAQAATKAAPAIPGMIARTVGTSMAPAVGAGIGEGGIMAGQAMQNSLEAGVDPRTAAGYAGATGLVGGALGAVGGKVAQRMGVVDPETLIAGGIGRKASDATGLAAAREFGKRVAGGAISEGLFEELPQSVFEQGFQNLAQGKPLTEGVARAGVEGALAGSFMGGAFNAIPGGRYAESKIREQEKPQDEQQPIAGLLPSPTYTGTPGGQLVENDAARQAAIDAADKNAADLYAMRDAFEQSRQNVTLLADPVPVQQRIDAMLGLDTARMDKKGRALYEKDLAAAFGEQIGITHDENKNEVPFTMGEYLDAQVRTEDTARSRPLRSNANEQAGNRLAQLADEETQQQIALTQDLARSAAQGGALSRAALSGIRTGAVQMPTHPMRAEIEQQALAEEVAQAELTPVERLMRSRSDAQVQRIADNEKALPKIRQAAIADLQRRLAAQAQPTTTSPLPQTATQFNMPAPITAQSQNIATNPVTNVQTSTEQQPAAQPVTTEIAKAANREKLAKVRSAKQAKNAPSNPQSNDTNQELAAVNTEKPAEAQKAESEGQTKASQQISRPPIERRDDLVGAILRATGGNGIAANMAQTIVGDKADAATKVRGLFTNRGTMDLDDTAELLRVQEGYDVRDGNHLAELIREQASGNPVHSMERVEREAAKGAEKQYRNDIRQRAAALGIKTVARKFDDIERAVLEAETKQAQDEADEERAAIQADEAVSELDDDQINALLDMAGQDERETGRYINGQRSSNEEILDAFEPVGESEDEQGADGAGEAVSGEAGGSRQERGQEARPDFGLDSQTNEQAAEQFAQQQAEESVEPSNAQADRERDAVPFSLGTQSQPKPKGVQTGMFTADGRVSEDANPAAQSESGDESKSIFIKAPNGSVDFGEITESMAGAMRRQSGKIRLEKGDGSFGLQHIDERHGAQIRSLGYDSIEAFVLDAVTHIESIWSPAKTSQMVLLQAAGKDKAVFIELKPSPNGDFYTVNTAFPVGKFYSKNKGWKLLWDGASVPTEASGANPLVEQSPNAGAAAAMTPGQSSESSVAKQQAEDKPAAVGAEKAAEIDIQIANKVIEQAESIVPEEQTVIEADPAEAAKEDSRIGDFGRKVIVRKDLAKPTGPRFSSVAKDDRPAWSRKYHAMQIKEVAGWINQKNVGKWRIMKESGAMKGAVSAVTSQTFATEQEALDALPLVVALQKHRIYSYDAKPVSTEAASESTKNANDWLEGVVKDIDSLRQGNEKLLMQAQITKRFQRGVAEGAMTQAQYDKALADGTVLSADEMKRADDLNAKIDAIRAREIKQTHSEPQAKFGIFRNITDKKRALVRGGFDTQEEASAYLAANPIEIIEYKFGFPERPWLDRIERIGPERLTGNVTKEMFEKTFAPSGVVYGNWLLNKDGTVNADGQELSNHIYNSLLDLAEAINVPPKALFLNGKMALGVGADGKGGTGAAAAHYSPSKALINLTKIKGAGTLAHEWWHSVDHYFADTSGKADSDSAVSNGYSPSRTTARPELVEAIKNIVDTMMYSEKSQTTDADMIKNRAQQRIDSARSSIEYRVRDWRGMLIDGRYNRNKKVATKEQLAQFDSMAERLKNGDMGASVYIENPSKMRDAMGFETGEVLRDMNAIYKSVTGRSFLRQDPQSPGRRAKWDVDAIKDNKEKLNTKEAKTETVKGRSSFYIESRRIDQQHVGDYWSSPNEMGARAFESYIFDKVTEKGERSDYLVYGVENRYYAAQDMYPYPEGSERNAINKAFDNLFSTLETKETDKGVALYSKRVDMTALETANRRMDKFVNEAESGRLKDGDTQILGDTPTVLQAIGAESLPILIDGETVNKVVHNKHRYFVTTEMLRALPSHLYDPLAVFDSPDPRTGAPGKLILTESADPINGEPIIIAIHLGKQQGRYVVNDISSIYAANKGTQQRKLTSDAIEYYRNEKSLEQSTTPSLDISLRDVVQSAQDSGKTLLTEADVVNRYGSRYSFGNEQSQPMPQPEAESSIKSMLGDKLGKVLIDSGIVSFTNKGNEYEGATYKDGSIVLNLDALNADNFAGILAHEGFHSTIRELVGEQTYTQLMKRLDNMRAMGNGSQWFKDAAAAVPKDTKAENVTEEIAAYAIKGYVNSAKQPNVITRWVESLLSALRTAIIRRMPFGKLKSWAANNLQPQDLANLAIAGLKAKARGQLQAQGREAMAFSKINQTDALDIRYSRAQIIGDSGRQSAFGIPKPSKMDDVIYAMQDKQVDLRRVVQSIKKAGGNLTDSNNAYLQEELFHGRASKGVHDFLNNELRPLVAQMRSLNVEMVDFEEYLWNRHAEERNKQIAKINEQMPDGGSGIKTADARAYLSALAPAKKAAYESLAKRVDAINRNSQAILVRSGLEKQETIDAWNGAYSNYVPLHREDVDTGHVGTGKGYSIRGSASKRAVGSNKSVVDILANIAMQRERNIVRAEKNRVSNALYGLAVANPNADLWEVDKAPTERVVVNRGGKDEVVTRIVPGFRQQDNVIHTRINGDDHFVIMDEKNPRSVRMAQSIKNLDIDQLGRVLSNTAKATRYMASINTQFNPVFGVVNLTRDTQGAMLNLSTTPLAGQQKKVLGYTLSALRGIYSDLRDHRQGKAPSSSWAQEFEEFQKAGGQTGYRDQYSNSAERADAITKELKSLDRNWIFKRGGAIFDWLSDYNESMENAVRVAAFRAAKEHGMSVEQSASLAKNLTVNFNRKGQVATQMGALYAFFNASVQGTARLAETMAGPMGKKILYGGLLLGSMQAMLLAAAGMGDDEPPEFVRERSIIIPIGDGKYVSIPMPLGFHVIPNLSRIPTEFVLSGFKDPAKRIADMFGLFADTFNPIGNSGFSLQTIAPTVIDPLAALSENRDWTGKPIAKMDRDSLNPTPGYLRAKDTATSWSRAISYGFNLLSGGTDHKKGLFSPTPDQIDYLIGQATGGIGREVSKTEQTVTSLFSGEDLPMHKIPLFGRFIGDTTGQSAEGGKFYAAIQRINEHENEIKGLREKKDAEGIREYIMDNPEARLVIGANHVEREIQKLRIMKRDAVEKDDTERVKALESQIKSRMKMFNDRVRSLSEKSAA